jgi:hypothetical protein
LPPVKAGFANQRHGFTERLNDRCKQEVAAEFHEIGNLRGLGGDSARRLRRANRVRSRFSEPIN